MTAIPRPVPGPAGDFTLTARADRIDLLADGSLAVVDYKTGQPPSAPQVESGLVPQLSLEAAMIERGAFPDLPENPVGQLAYLRLSGGRPPGQERVLKLDAAAVAAHAFEGLTNRIAAFDREETPYLSRLRPMFEGREGDYDHLARVREWSSGTGEGE